MSIDKIRNIGLDKLVTQVYDFDSLTTDELLCKFAQKINIIIEHLKYIDDRSYNSDKAMEEKLHYLLGQGLEEQVAKRLLDLINNGTLGKLINETLLKDINDKLVNIENKVVELKADKTGETDISDLLKACIEKANTENKSVFIPKGNYKIEKTVELNDINNVIIMCEIGTNFIVGLTDVNNYNVIKFNNSNNIIFLGAKCTNTNDNLRSRNLYNGSFLTFNKCSFVEVNHCISENMNYLVQLYQNCHDVKIYYNVFYNPSIKAQ